MEISLSRKQFEALKYGALAIYVSVAVSYEDIFGGKRLTRMGFKVSDEGLIHDDVTVWDFFNEAT